jgi:hypothetical protein
MSSASLRPSSPFVSFDSETGARRPRWVILLAGLLALLIGFAGLAVGVGSASAHDRNYDVSCFGIKVKLTNYNNHGGKVNTVSIVIDGVEQVPAATKANFGTDYTFQTTWDASVSHTYSIEVHGHDGYDLVVPTTTQQPCAKPEVGLQATECNETDGVTNLSATVSGFASYQSPKDGYPSFTESYTGTLYQDGFVYQTELDVQDSDGTFEWEAPAGHTYTWEVKGDDNAGLSASAEAKVIGCPQNSQLLVTPQECTSPTQANASVLVEASLLTPGRSYTAVVKKGSTILAGPLAVVPLPDGTATLSIPVPPATSGMTVELTDIEATTTVPSAPFNTKPCPSQPLSPTVGHEVCTTVGGALDITVSLSALTPGRGYLIQIDGVQVDEIIADGTSQGGLTYPVTAGSHTVTIIDKAEPSITATSAPVEVKDCPTQPQLSFTITECLAAGETGAVKATFSGLGVGRDYTVTITDQNGAVSRYPDPISVTSTSAPIDFTGLPAGMTYTVTIVDDLAPAVKDAESVTLDECPMTPKIALALECLFLDGDSLVEATITDLADGEEYTVEIVDDSTPVATGGGLGGGTASTALAAPVDSETVTGGPTPSTVVFQVPNNLTYTVTVTSVSNPLVTNTAQIFAAICDLPTFPLPPELPTLALTGSGDTTVPMLGALGLVQFGVALLALAAMVQFTPRRRSA